MKILVSACLLGENCKYNGKNNYSERVAKYLEGHEVIPVDRKSTRLNSSHKHRSRMPSSA